MQNGVCAAICVLFTIFVASVAQAMPHRVRVRLAHRPDLISVSGHNIKIGTLAHRVPMGRNHWEIRQGDRPLWIEADELTVNGEGVPSPVLYDDGHLISELDLEEYIKTVVASEMPASWPLEALKAQAVASRTYAVKLMEERKDRKYHLESSVMHQVFNHSKYSKLLKTYRMKVDKAVEETQGEILVHPKTGYAIKSYYHSHCGGETKTAQKVWGEIDRTRSVKDPYCALDTKGEWSLRLSLGQLQKKLLPEIEGQMDNLFIEIDRENISSIDTGSQGIERVKISWSDKSVIFPANEFRRRLGYNQLKSTNFSLSRVANGYLFKGRGYGHGVGMCQTGSRARAKAHQGYRQILSHYYPGAKLRQLHIKNKIAGR